MYVFLFRVCEPAYILFGLLVVTKGCRWQNALSFVEVNKPWKQNVSNSREIISGGTGSEQSGTTVPALEIIIQCTQRKTLKPNWSVAASKTFNKMLMYREIWRLTRDDPIKTDLINIIDILGRTEVEDLINIISDEKRQWMNMRRNNFCGRLFIYVVECSRLLIYLIKNFK